MSKQRVCKACKGFDPNFDPNVGAGLIAGTVMSILIFRKIQAGAINVPSFTGETLSPLVQNATKDSGFALDFKQSASPLIEVPTESVVSINGGMEFDVSKHIRNLTGGRFPSEEKVRTALENGFELGPHQTWVESYTKNKVA